MSKALPPGFEIDLEAAPGAPAPAPAPVAPPIVPAAPAAPVPGAPVAGAVPPAAPTQPRGATHVPMAGGGESLVHFPRANISDVPPPSPEALAAVSEQQGAGGLPAGFEIEEEPETTVSRQAIIASQGFQNGIANLIGAPVDVVAEGLRMAGINISDDPVGGSKQLKEIFHFLQRDTNFNQMRQLEARNTKERFTQRTAEEVGAAFAALIPLLQFAKAGQVVQAGRAAVPTTVSGRIAQTIKEPFRQAPVKASAVELGFGGAAGVGAATAQEIAPGNTTAEIFGALLGVGTAAGTVKGLQLTGRGIHSALEPFSSEGLARRTGKALVESATDPESLLRGSPATQAELEAPLPGTGEARKPAAATPEGPADPSRRKFLQGTAATAAAATTRGAPVPKTTTAATVERTLASDQQAMDTLGEWLIKREDYHVDSAETLIDHLNFLAPPPKGAPAVIVPEKAPLPKGATEADEIAIMNKEFVDATHAWLRARGITPPEDPTKIVDAIKGVIKATGGAGSRIPETPTATQLQLEAPKGEAALQEALEAPRVRFEELRPTTAQATGDPGVAALEAEIAKESPRLAGVIRQQQIANDQLLMEELDSLAPQVVDPAATLARGVQDRVAAIRSSLDTRVAQAQQNVEEAIAALGETPSKSASNKIMREEMAGARADAEAVEASVWKNIDPRGSHKVDVTPLAASVDDFIKNTKKADIPLLPEEILALLGAGGKKGPTTLTGKENISEIFGAASRLSTMIREAKQAGNFGLERLLTSMKKEVIDPFMNGVAFPDAAMADRYAIAKEYTKEMNDVFNRSAVTDLAATVRGRPKVPESATAETFFHPGKGADEAMQDFLRATEGMTVRQAAKEAVKDAPTGSRARPQAVQAMREFIRRSLFELVGEEGKFNSKLTREWIKKNRSTLRQFPELLDEFGNLQKIQARAEEVIAGRTRTEAAIQKSAAKFFLEQDPDIAVKSALASKNPAASFRDIRNRVRNDPQALAGIRRSVLEHIKTGANGRLRLPNGNHVINPEAIETFVKRYRRSMGAMGYKEADIQRMLDIAEKARVNMGGSAAKSRATTAEREKSFLSINQLLSRLYGIQRGVVSKRFVAGEIGARIVTRWINRLNHKELEALLEQALADPDFARTLALPIVTEANQRKVLRAMSTHLASRAAAAPVATGAITEEEQ